MTEQAKKTTAYLHIFNNEKKFSKGFFEFMSHHNFDLSCHELFHYGHHDEGYKKFKFNFIFARYFSVLKHLKLLAMMFRSKTIFVHSLASPWLLLFLYLFPRLRKKVYWLIWGKDLYFYKLLKKKHFYHEIYEFFRIRVFKDIKHVVTYVKGDYSLAKRWYGLDAEYHECFMYPSNLYKHINIQSKPHEGINIQVGNSADPSNNHLEIFEHLSQFKSQPIKLFTPLSYGDQNHAKEVIKTGQEMFGDQFVALTEFMPYEDYLKFLSDIDIAVFAHNRQQAMGNTISLIGLGKKIFMKPNISSWDLFTEIGLKVYDINTLDLDRLTEAQKSHNQMAVRTYFSEENYLKQLKTLFRSSC